jgi:hypothetical protein
MDAELRERAAKLLDWLDGNPDALTVRDLLAALGAAERDVDALRMTLVGVRHCANCDTCANNATATIAAVARRGGEGGGE